MKALHEDKIDINNNGKSVVYPQATKYNHYFSDGLYVREMFCEKNYFGFREQILFSKLRKHVFKPRLR